MTFVDYLTRHNILPKQELEQYQSFSKQKKIEFLEDLMKLFSELAATGKFTFNPELAASIAFELGDLTKGQNPIGNQDDGNLSELMAQISDRNWEAWFPEEVNLNAMPGNKIFCEAVIFSNNEKDDWESTEAKSLKSRFNALAKAYYRAQ